MTSVVLILVLSGLEVLETVFLNLTIDSLVALGWILIAYKRWRISAFLLPLVFLFFSGYMVYAVGPITTMVLQLVVAVLLAGMLLGNKARWSMVVLSLLVYFVAGWASGMLNFEIIISSGVLMAVTLAAVAFLESFFANQLNKSLKTVREREAKLQSIFRAAPIGIGLVVDRVIQEVNITLCQMTGYTREELIGQSSRILYSSQEDFEYVGSEKYRQINQHGLGTVETRWLRKDGTFRDILLSSVPLDPNNLSMGVTFSALDITERRLAELALRRSEERYRFLFDEMLSGFALHEIICDQDGMPIDYRFLAVNKEFEQLTGLKADELIGRTVREALPGIEPFWIERYGRVALEGDSDQFDGYSAALGKHYEARAFCPEPGKFAVMFHDVTERKKAEEEVRKSKQALEKAERLVHLGHYEIDTETGEAIWSDEIFNIFGLDPNSSAPTVEIYYDLIHPDDRPIVNALYQESTKNEIPFDLVYRILRKDGSIRYVHSHANLVEEATGSPKLFGTLQDVTEIKQVELALQESQALYHDLVETAQDLIWQCDWEGRYVYLNPAWAEVFGYELREMLGKPFSQFQTPEFARRDMDTFLHLLEGHSVAHYETVHLAKDGSELHLVFNAKAVRDAQGNITGTRGTAYDISERKHAETALKKSEYLLQESQKLAKIGHYELDIVAGRWKSSNALNDLFGIDWNYNCNLEGWLDIVYPSDRDVMKVYFLEEVLQKRQNFDREYRIARISDGEIRWVHGLGKLELNTDGNPVKLVGNIQDITEYKHAEMELRESADRYQAVVENQTEFIVRWRPDGIRSFVNEAYLRYYNLTLEEALSSPFFPLVAEEDRAAVEKKMVRLITGAVSSETDTHRVIRPDGTIAWQEWTDRAILDEDGSIVEFQSVGRDITERMLADEALRAKTEELEALFSISSHLRAAQSADAMLPVVLEEMRRVLRSDANAVILLDPDNEHFRYALSDGPLRVNDGLQFTVEESISGLVLQTRQPYITDNLFSDPRKSSSVQGDDELGPAIVVPVISESEFLGVLVCARKKNGASRQYSSSEVRLLTAIGEMVGNALRRARLYDQALKRLQHLQTLHSIDTAISANLDLPLILDVLLTRGIAQLDVDAACVMLLDAHTHMLQYTAGKGFRGKEISTARLRIGEGLPGKVALDRKVLHVPNLSRVEDQCRKYLMEEGFVAYKAAPLIAKGQLQGVLEIFNRQPMDGGDEQTEFLETLATQAAIAIDNSYLFSELQRSNFELEMAYDATIEGWSHALELRDMETEGHTLRVSEMTLQMAQEIRVKSGDLIHIRRGALLHDIGKVGVPDRILLKPGKLKEDEWEIMKKHTVYAYEMLRPIEFLRQAIDIPYCHHERWDGTGYPRQLKGEQIPLSARLFAVADVWDALTSDRPYRKAWSEEQALDYIVSNAGTHFDPRVVEVFLTLRSKNGMGTAFV